MRHAPKFQGGDYDIGRCIISCSFHDGLLRRSVYYNAKDLHGYAIWAMPSPLDLGLIEAGL